MRTIHFHKSLQKYTENLPSITVDVFSYYDLLKASIDLFSKLNTLFKKINIDNNIELALIVDKKVLSLEHIFMPATGKEIKLVPLIKGSGRAGMIIAAIAIVVLVVATGQIQFAALGAEAAAAAGAEAVFAGVAAASTGFAITTVGQLALGIAASLFLSALQPTPKPPRIQSNTGGFRKNNDIFDGLTNTTSSQAPVFLNYGETRIAGQLLSGFIKTVDHGKEDIVSVSDQFTS